MYMSAVLPELALLAGNNLDAKLCERLRIFLFNRAKQVIEIMHTHIELIRGS